MKKKIPATSKLTKAQKKVRKAPLGSGYIKKTAQTIRERQKKQRDILKELGI